MKKHILLTGLALILSLFFVSCTEDSSVPYTIFKDYSTFSANRAAWVEPSNYSFTYDFRKGSQYRQAPVSVSVKDGTPTLSSEDERDLEYLKIFNSITEVYDYFEDHWQKTKSEEYTDLRIVYSVKYKTVNGVLYPQTLKEDIEWCGKGDAPIGADSGGILIVISDFVIND